MSELDSPSLRSGVAANRYQPLVIVFAAAGLGMAADRAAAVPVVLWWLAAAIASGGWIALRRQRRDDHASWCLLLTVGTLAAAWHGYWWRMYSPNELASWASDDPQPAVLRATVVSGPRYVPAPDFNPLWAIQPGQRSRLVVQAESLRVGQDWVPASGRTVVRVEGAVTGLLPGDRLLVLGHLSRSQPAMNPGDLDFHEFARAERRLTFLRTDDASGLQLVAAGSEWHWRRALERARRLGQDVLNEHIRPERRGLAAALLLGAREQLDYERTGLYLRTGTIHVLAISGAHVAILASFLLYALRFGFLGRKPALLAVAAVVFGYTLLTDAEPSAVRAMILVLLVCAALYLGRPAAAFNCWAAGGLIVIALNPADVFRAGPQLSFLAVAVMAWLAPQWAKWSETDPLETLIAATRPWPIRWLRWLFTWTWRTTFVTVAIWLVAAPLVMLRFHLASPAAIPLTTFLLAPSSLALLSGFLLLAGGWLLPPLGSILGWVCDVSLQVLDGAVSVATQIPGSYLWVAGPEAWWVAGFYVGLGVWAASPRLRDRKTLCRRILAAWLLAWLLADAWRSRATGDLQATVLSMGHGCGVVLQLPEGRTALYDAGRMGSPTAGARSVAGCLWHRGVRRLDAVIVSHADVDHYNALPELLEQFDVDAVYVSPAMFRERTAALDLLLAAIEKNGAELRQLAAGQDVPLASVCRLRTLHPPVEGVVGSDNANSLVIAVDFAARRLLLTGDVEAAGMRELQRQPAEDCDVLLAPHHGSVRSNPPEFAAWSRPEWIVVSASREGNVEQMGRAYRLPPDRVLHTAYDGAIRIAISPDGAMSLMKWDQGWRVP